MNLQYPLIAGVLAFSSIAALGATGDAADYDPPRASLTSTRSRADVRAEVLSARAAGELRPAGEAEAYTVARGPVTWARSRAEVKAEVIAARANGELVPAGEGGSPGVDAAIRSRQTKYAQAARKLHPTP
jgi:hypothetical protein